MSKGSDPPSLLSLSRASVKWGERHPPCWIAASCDGIKPYRAARCTPAHITGSLPGRGVRPGQERCLLPAFMAGGTEGVCPVAVLVLPQPAHRTGKAVTESKQDFYGPGGLAPPRVKALSSRTQPGTLTHKVTQGHQSLGTGKWGPLAPPTIQS